MRRVTILCGLAWLAAGCAAPTYELRVQKQRRELAERARPLRQEMEPDDVKAIMGDPQVVWTAASPPRGYTYPQGVAEIWAWGVDLPFGYRKAVVEVNFSRGASGALRAWQIYVEGARAGHN